MAIGTVIASGGASLPLTGTGATVTASAPLLDLSQTWNNAAVTFTALKLNVTSTASAVTSILLDLQKGGVSQFNVRNDGLTSAAQFVTATNGTAANPAFIVGGTNTGMFGTSTSVQFSTAATARVGITSNGVNLPTSGVYGFNSTTSVTGSDTGLSRSGAGIISVGNSTAGDLSGELRLTKLTSAGTLQSGAPAGATAGLWKLGSLVTAAVVVDTSRSLFVDIGGTVYKLIVAV